MENSGSSRSAMRAHFLLLTLAAVVVVATGHRTLRVLAAADEIIYMVGARSVLERGTLDTTFFLPYSVLAQGLPHRDVHMPGYILCLSPFVAAFGPTHWAPATLNVLLYAAMILLVHAIAREVLQDERRAVTAAALAGVLPPFPGYLFVAFPEFILVVLFLTELWLSLKSAGAGPEARKNRIAAALAGFLFGVGPLFRENLLLALPIPLALLPRRLLVRRFLPAAVATLVLVYGSFSRNRAILPNNVFPGMLLVSFQSETPVASLWASLWQNLGRNLRLVLEARPFRNVEDTVLLFLLALGLGALWTVRGSTGRVRRVAISVVFSFGLVAAAVFAAYAVRATGRPWAGVRQFMAWLPALLILNTPHLFRPEKTWKKLVLTASAAGVFVAIGVTHIDFVNWWKGTDLKAGRKLEAYISRHTDAFRPQRLVVRSNYVFLYGLSHFPVEIVWPLQSQEEFLALEKAIDYDFLVLASGPALADVPPQGSRRYQLVHAHRLRKWSIWRRRLSQGQGVPGSGAW